MTENEENERHKENINPRVAADLWVWPVEKLVLACHKCNLPVFYVVLPKSGLPF
jgi:hypothetical protein